MSYWEDYYEPSEFEIQMAEFRQSIIDNVRQDIKDKIDRLEKENAELREVKKNWKSIKKEHEDAIRELKLKEENLEREIKKKKVKEILKDIAVIGYRLDWNYKELPKCDKCDKNRRIHFISPMGREMTEECECAKRIPLYFPKEVKLLRFESGDKSVHSKWYEVKEDEDYSDRWSYSDATYTELPDNLTTISIYRAVFLSKEDCQKFCDWKNAQTKDGNDV